MNLIASNAAEGIADRDAGSSKEALTIQRGINRITTIITGFLPDESLFDVVKTMLEAIVADNTRLRYAQDLRIFLGWAHVDGIDPRTATAEDLVRYQDYIKRFGGASQMRLMTVLRLFYREMEAAGVLVDGNPTRSLPRVRGKGEDQPEAYSEHEIEELLASIKEQMASSNDDYVHRYLAIRDYAIVQLALTSGIRASELVALTCDDVHLASAGTGTLLIRGRKTREVVVPREVMEGIDEYKTAMAELGLTLDHDDPLFIRIGPKADPQYAEAMTTRNLGKLVTKWATQASLGGKHKAVHQLRRTAATRAYGKSASVEDVASMLGHVDPRTTRDLYIKTASDHINLG